MHRKHYHRPAAVAGALLLTVLLALPTAGLAQLGELPSLPTLPTRVLGGGDIEFHKPNPSTTGLSTPPDEITACGSDDSGLGT